MNTIEQVHLNITGGIKYIAKAFQSVSGTRYPSALKEWLECQDFILGMKGIHIGMHPVNTDSLRHFKTAAQDIIAVPHYNNKAIFAAVKTFFSHTFNACENVGDIVECIDAETKPALEQLHEASLNNKREVLRYMQIIPTPIAAAYLGISEHALNEWKGYYQTFGSRYAGGHCYSLEELKLIANNRWWMHTGVVADDIRVTDVNDEKSLDQVVMVDEKTAIAFTDMTHGELMEKMPRNALLHRQYRLSDLEKIRIAKQNAIA